jgi:hypothetical protein
MNPIRAVCCVVSIIVGKRDHTKHPRPGNCEAVAQFLYGMS